MRLNWSTVEVPPNEINLANTQWLQYSIPNDRFEDFKRDVLTPASEALRLGFREHKDDLASLIAISKDFTHYRHYQAFKKIKTMMEVIDHELQLGAYGKVVLFAEHADLMRYAQISLQKYAPLCLYMKSNPIKAEQNLKKFNTPNNKTKVFISTIKAASLAHVKFPVTKFAFFLETSVNPRENLNALSKLSGEKIFARSFILTEDTLEPRLEKMIRSESLNLSETFDLDTKGVSDATTTSLSV